MSPRNTAKADIVLKNFWKDNAHFADLFNAVLFDGEQKLQFSNAIFFIYCNNII